jgi:RNase P subunit RPR2
VVVVNTSQIEEAARLLKGVEMSKQAMREETERLVREAIERKTVIVKQGNTRIEEKCGKCGAPNRISAAQGQVRVAYTCKECGQEQRTL